MRSLHQQVRDAWKLSKIDLSELAKLAGLDCTTASLSRKLSGSQPLSTAECEKLAAAMGVNLIWSPDDAKAEGAA
jgi:transcriptional regulator with XRE-family HTH domain